MIRRTARRAFRESRTVIGTSSIQDHSAAAGNTADPVQAFRNLQMIAIPESRRVNALGTRQLSLPIRGMLTLFSEIVAQPQNR